MLLLGNNPPTCFLRQALCHRLAVLRIDNDIESAASRLDTLRDGAAWLKRAGHGRAIVLNLYDLQETFLNSSATATAAFFSHCRIGFFRGTVLNRGALTVMLGFFLALRFLRV